MIDYFFTLFFLLLSFFIFAYVPCLPGVERVFPGQRVGAVATYEHLDAVIEGAHAGLGRRVLLDDQQGVP